MYLQYISLPFPMRLDQIPRSETICGTPWKSKLSTHKTTTPQRPNPAQTKGSWQQNVEACQNAHDSMREITDLRKVQTKPKAQHHQQNDDALEMAASPIFGKT